MGAAVGGHNDTDSGPPPAIPARASAQCGDSDSMGDDFRNRSSSGTIAPAPPARASLAERSGQIPEESDGEGSDYEVPIAAPDGLGEEPGSEDEYAEPSLYVPLSVPLTVPLSVLPSVPLFHCHGGERGRVLLCFTFTRV